MIKNESINSIAVIIITIFLTILMTIFITEKTLLVFEISLFTLCVCIIFIFQWIAFIPSYLYKTERFFDLTGSITYITVILFAIVFNQKTDFRSLLVTILIGIWTIRLGTFLFMRIKTFGFDRRFDNIKHHFTKYLMTWTLQGFWVFMSVAPGLLVITNIKKLPIETFAVLGFSIWIIGFIIEIIADYQKFVFRLDLKNKDRFIKTGFWTWSRHPNYFGEILLWIGISIIAFPVLVGWQYITLISPVFIFFLLTRISGIPMLESKADKKWGNHPAYKKYKKNTPILFPFF